ncbi:MAG: hypothetical protein J6B87_07150 [Clostridia bacterium]|nr:hypothetical protein [Clostridia bacterium]
MSNESPIIFDSDYEYVLGEIRGNVLNLQGNFGGMDWLREEIYIISKELENTAKTFAEKQNLRETGNLINSTHAVVENNTKINFFNNAQNPYGRFYAGHIEYGYHTRKGDFVPARPFMRPALYAVADASKGSLQGALGRYLSDVVRGVGDPGALSLNFGRAASSQNYTRVFYQQQTKGRGASKNTGHYTSKGLTNPSMNKQESFSLLRDKDSRLSMSVIRGEDQTRFMTSRSTLDRLGQSDSTRKLGQYGKSPGRTGRPDEGRARVPSNRSVGRPATGQKESYYKPTGKKPTGRPKIYNSPKEWPSKQRIYSKPGRPKIYSSPKEWPSRQRIYDRPGRPSKNQVKKKKGSKAEQRIKSFDKKTKWEGVKGYKENYNYQWDTKYGSKSLFSAESLSRTTAKRNNIKENSGSQSQTKSYIKYNSLEEYYQANKGRFSSRREAKRAWDNYE